MRVCGEDSFGFSGASARGDAAHLVLARAGGLVRGGARACGFEPRRYNQPVAVIPPQSDSSVVLRVEQTGFERDPLDIRPSPELAPRRNVHP